MSILNFGVRLRFFRRLTVVWKILAQAFSWISAFLLFSPVLHPPWEILIYWSWVLVLSRLVIVLWNLLWDLSNKKWLGRLPQYDNFHFCCLSLFYWFHRSTCCSGHAKFSQCIFRVTQGDFWHFEWNFYIRVMDSQPQYNSVLCIWSNQ